MVLERLALGTEEKRKFRLVLESKWNKRALGL
jgi:hypothetical protein